MTAAQIANIIEDFAPLSFQASYDNAGFVVGRKDRNVGGVLLAVDVTEEVIEEAISLGVNMIITHHPIIFNPLKRLTSSTYVERCVEMAIKNDIILYAAHTNLDSAPMGMSWKVGEILGLCNMEVLSATSADKSVGYGVVGDLLEPKEMLEYIKYVGQTLNCKSLRYSDIVGGECRRVAICTGSGASLMGEAKSSGANLYITADLKYNDFMTPSAEYTVVDVGHYESEYCAIDILFDILSKKIINFAVHKSRCTRNPINYMSL
ncbi:MAG: Nif3-like dinuclear metal center hexameric protein [Rikenellaceae bacterium]